MMQHIVTRRDKGEYSTVLLPSGVIETCYFPDDPNKESRIVGRVYPQSVEQVHLDMMAMDR